MCSADAGVCHVWKATGEIGKTENQQKKEMSSEKRTPFNVRKYLEELNGIMV